MNNMAALGHHRYGPSSPSLAVFAPRRLLSVAFALQLLLTDPSWNRPHSGCFCHANSLHDSDVGAVKLRTTMLRLAASSSVAREKEQDYKLKIDKEKREGSFFLDALRSERDKNDKSASSREGRRVNPPAHLRIRPPIRQELHKDDTTWQRHLLKNDDESQPQVYEAEEAYTSASVEVRSGYVEFDTTSMGISATGTGSTTDDGDGSEWIEWDNVRVSKPGGQKYALTFRYYSVMESTDSDDSDSSDSSSSSDFSFGSGTTRRRCALVVNGYFHGFVSFDPESTTSNTLATTVNVTASNATASNSTDWIETTIHNVVIPNAKPGKNTIRLVVLFGRGPDRLDHMTIIKESAMPDEGENATHQAPATMAPTSWSDRYPSCEVRHPSWVGDGYCDEDAVFYNTEECGWDGGDCCLESCVPNVAYDCREEWMDCQDPIVLGGSPSLAPSSLPSASMNITSNTSNQTSRAPPPFIDDPALLCPLGSVDSSPTKYRVKSSSERFAQTSYMVYSHQVTAEGHNIVWMGSDGGQDEISAVDLVTGEILRTFGLANIDVDDKSDWESISLGPCGPLSGLDWSTGMNDNENNGMENKTKTRPCLYIGNMGNNKAATCSDRSCGKGRDEVEIYKLVEPDVVTEADNRDKTFVNVATLRVNYHHEGLPTNRADCETMFVDWTGDHRGGQPGDIYLVTKFYKQRRHLQRLVKIPVDVHASIQPNQAVTYSMEPAGTPNQYGTSDDMWVDGDMAAGGNLIALRTKTYVRFYPRTWNTTVAEAIENEPCQFTSKVSKEKGEGDRFESVALMGSQMAEAAECYKEKACDVPVTVHELVYEFD